MGLLKKTFSEIYHEQLKKMPEQVRYFALCRFEIMKNYPLHEICKKLMIPNLVGYDLTLKIKRKLNLASGKKKQSREFLQKVKK